MSMCRNGHTLVSNPLRSKRPSLKVSYRGVEDYIKNIYARVHKNFLAMQILQTFESEGHMVRIDKILDSLAFLSMLVKHHNILTTGSFIFLHCSLRRLNFSLLMNSLLGLIKKDHHTEQP